MGLQDKADLLKPPFIELLVVYSHQFTFSCSNFCKYSRPCHHGHQTFVLYTSGTPNGQKASITLEELGQPYTVENIKISKNVQKEDWFLRIYPNGRIPAIVDKTPSANGQPQQKRIFESGALMLYLCERYDKDHKVCYPYDADEYWKVVE